MDPKRLAATLLILAGLLALPGVVEGQLTYDEAAARFAELGCTSCHNGRAAPTFDQVVQLFEQWGQQYDNIDDAIANEVPGYSSYDQMMASMARFVGVTVDDIQDLYQFFIEVFQSAQPAQQDTATQQDTTTQAEATATTAQTTEAAGEEPAATTTQAEEPGLAPAFAAGIILAVIIAGAAYMLAKK